jgi:hypothetical protein
VAALLLQTAPCLLDGGAGDDALAERAALSEAMLGAAIDLPPAGSDPATGRGRSDAFAASTAMLPIPRPGPDRVVECAGHAGTAVTLDGNASIPFAPTCALRYTWSGPFGIASGPSPTVLLPPGENLVHLAVSQNGVTEVSASQTIDVADTLPPRLQASVAPAILWPPDHALRDISLSALVSDLCDPRPLVRLIGAASSEPDDAPGGGDGRTTGDIVPPGSADPSSPLRLRAERAADGPGRAYTVRIEAVDASGNAAAEAAAVCVPHDRSSACPGDTARK